MDLTVFKKQCSDYMFWSYGTGEIFRRREASLKARRLWITYFGIIGPVVLGSVLATLGAGVESAKMLAVAIIVAGIVGTGQLIFSVWALVARWDENYEAAQNAVRVNTILFNRFSSIRDIPPTDYMQAFIDTKADYQRQEEIDNRQTIKPTEKRFANHEALRYFGKECHICHVVPTSTKPSKCDSCGNY